MSKWLKLGGAITLVGAALWAATALPLGDGIGRLVEAIRGAGALGLLLYALAYVAAALLLLPGSLLTLGAGLAYGPFYGTLLVSPVSVAAASAAFLLGRTAARPWIQKRVEADRRFAAIDSAIGRHGFKIVALLRLSPVLPFNLLNYALGLTRVGLRDFVLASFVGMLPGTILYVYLGSLVTSVSELSTSAEGGGASRQVLYWAGLGATVLVSLYVTRIARRALNEELAK